MLTISGLTYRVGGRHGRALLNEANAQIPDGSKLGLVGRNGAGKSTLLDLIRGRLLSDAGDVFVPRGWRIGFLAQEAPTGEATPFDTVLAADRERAALLRELDRGAEPLRIGEIEARLDEIGARSAPSRAGRILAGLGLDAAMQARPLSQLSGGWRMRVALAAVLFAEPDLLLLDEPTNHLDLEAALWLERFLRRYRHTFVAGQPRPSAAQRSHDRDPAYRKRQTDPLFGRLREIPARPPRGRRASDRAGAPPAAGTRPVAGLCRPFPGQGKQGAPSPEPHEGVGQARTGCADRGRAAAGAPPAAAPRAEPTAGFARTHQRRLRTRPPDPVAARPAARSR